jgi:predicted ester cyclase
MSTEEKNKARFMEYEDALLHPDNLPEVLADGFVAHDLPPGMTLLEFRKMVMHIIPDEEVEVLQLIAEGNLVSCHSIGRGTHQGVFMGIPPSGKVLTFDIFEIVRFDENGKIVERWGMIDWVGLYRQMGVTHIPQG